MIDSPKIQIKKSLIDFLNKQLFHINLFIIKKKEFKTKI